MGLVTVALWVTLAVFPAATDVAAEAKTGLQQLLDLLARIRGDSTLLQSKIDFTPDLRVALFAFLISALAAAGQAEEAIDLGLDLLNGKKIDKEVTLSSRVFTKDNIDSGGQLLKD